MNITRAALLCLIAALAACDDAPCSTDDDCFSGEVCREDGKCRKAVEQDMSSPDLDMSSPDLDMSSPDLDEPDPDLGAPDMNMQGSCDGITCSGAGACVIMDGTPACACDPGYIAAGPSCILPAPTAVAAGKQHTCAIQRGELYCWGDNTKGQLGVGDTTTRDRPTAVSGLPADVTAVAAGGRHTCAIAGGLLYCWGDHERGQVGAGAGALLHSTPQPVTLNNTPTHITAGTQHTCAITSAGDLFCWGDHTNGRLGTGASNNTLTTPNPVAAPLTFSHVNAGDEHTCAISAGKTKCWGAGGSGRLGNMDTMYADQRTPTDLVMAPASPITDIAAGGRHTCAITSADELYCWGVNDRGELGTDKVPSSGATTPKLILADGVTHIATGQSHTCAIRSGVINCWGLNTSGQGGQGSLVAALTTPKPVTLTTPTAITAGAQHTCAIAAGALYCWGDNAQGQLGTGAPEGALTPTLIPLP